MQRMMKHEIQYRIMEEQLKHLQGLIDEEKSGA
jgi:hypothetical protein